MLTVTGCGGNTPQNNHGNRTGENITRNMNRTFNNNRTRSTNGNFRDGATAGARRTTRPTRAGNRARGFDRSTLRTPAGPNLNTGQRVGARNNDLNINTAPRVATPKVTTPKVRHSTRSTAPRAVVPRAAAPKVRSGQLTRSPNTTPKTSHPARPSIPGPNITTPEIGRTAATPNIATRQANVTPTPTVAPKAGSETTVNKNVGS